ncbi:hypothetical protein BX286_6490 [Streptomyces sp. 3211.6]|nr:hypothetical protein BX286_6490 [Streptomyces sp. 3211.6]RPF29792.1 hypothetical protein EDD96_6335 [Streptomyces sp. Ag109_G2-6]
MKKAFVCGAVALAVAAVLAQTFPDIKRYLRIRRM